MEDSNIYKFIEKAQKGDSEAFAVLYDAFSKKIFRFIRLKVQEKQRAEDLLQEVFIKVWRGLPQYQQSQGTFNAWIYRIATNAMNDYFRKIYRSPDTVELPDNFDMALPGTVTVNPAEKALDLELSVKELKEMLNQIPDAYRTVLELRYIQDLTLEETAEVLKKSNLAVRLLQHRALKKLKAIGQKNL